MTYSMTLGPRLQKVASLVPEGAILGDIGTDHAYLPITLVEEKKILRAVAVDVHEGPYQSALSAVKMRRLDQFIDVRMGDGLLPLEAGEINVLTLAGMGGRTMLEIFAGRQDVLRFVKDLIVQPQGAEGAVRLSLLNDGWLLKTEELVKEEDRIYTVLAFSKESGVNLMDLSKMEQVWQQRLASQSGEGPASESYLNTVCKLVWHFGPLILKEPTDLLREYLLEYKGMLFKRLQQMKRSNRPETLEKIKDVSEELALVEGIEAWQ
jgi:tRNA (adenine22-N1)-methyltransferase